MKTLTVCGTDIARFAIVTKPTPAPAEKTAAEFLQRVIETSCGVKLPISTIAENGICIGTREFCPEIKWDGFRTTTDEKNVYLDGNIPRGTLYAAYDFAEKYLGYRMFAADCEVIPTEGEADVPAGLDCIDNPVFEERRCDIYEFENYMDFANRSRLNTDPTCRADMKMGEERGGVAIKTSWGCHSFGSLLPGDVYFKEHPEYYALVDGERIPCNHGGGPGQPCLTNPDVIRIVTEKILNQLRTAPETPIVEISQCDNENYCRCERCAAVDEEEGGQSGTMIRFVNAVAEEVTKEFPNVLLRTFAYQYSRKPPKKVKAQPNVLVRYCTIEACFRHGLGDPCCEKNRSTLGSELREWRKVAKQISVWDYITNWNCFLAPYPNLVSLRENARFFAENHAIHVFEECNTNGYEGGAYSGLKAYLVGKLLWNPYMTEEEYERHICEFLAAFYGPGWEEIRRYIELEHDATEHRHISCFEDLDIALAWHSCEPFIRDLRYHLRRIYELHPNQPVYPDHALTELCGHMDEIKAMWDKAYELAENDTQRMHIDRSRMAIRYMDLAMIPRYWGTLSEEEQAAHEAEVEKFLEDKKKYNLHYNILTSGLPGKRRR